MNRRARRLFLDRHLLLRAESGPGAGPDLESVLHGLGFVQVDSVLTLARAHDLILWSRRGRFRPPALQRLVARDRAAFEHWTHDAAVIPMDFHPMWRLKFARDEARMQARWPQWRGEGWAAEIDASSWAQLLLKFILAEPAVTTVIPATSNPRYMADNLMAGQGRLPDARQREMIVEAFR